MTGPVPTVFVVDDDPVLLFLLRGILLEAGFRVEAFDQPEALVARLSARDRGCVVIDLRMPALSGLEVQQMLAARGVRLPLLFVSGRADVPAVVAAIKSGAVDFLAKPSDRIISRNQLTSAQIHQVRCLVAEQFIAREQMISWLRQRGRLGSPRDLDMLQHLFWELVDGCIDSGLGMVCLKVPPGAPDSEGEVVAAVCVKVLRAEDRPALPLPMTGDFEQSTLVAGLHRHD